MARLRIRIELSRGGLGVPLHKVASVISKSQKFLDLLGEDVHIDRSKGEWLGFDFDRESLNFTAEYVVPSVPSKLKPLMRLLTARPPFGGTRFLSLPA